MPERVKIVKGFQDVLPPLSLSLAGLERIARAVFARSGFFEIKLPLLEHAELFARSIGEHTDIVEKQMYTFQDRKGRSLSLRPEGTASAVRAYLDAGKGRGEPVKWYYHGPMFRYERPQKGRFRQFYQVGVEAIGYPGPGTDAEIILMLERFMREAGAAGFTIELNSLGCRKCRPAFREALVNYLRGVEDKLCAECKKRLEKNPLRVLDCKEPGCKEAAAGAPPILDFLDQECKEHFKGVQSDLDALGIEYRVNPMIVRGLDYYTRTVFELLVEKGLGSQNAVAAGGRYDDLVEEFGGPSTPAAGFAIGVDRLALVSGKQEEPVPDYFIVCAGEGTRQKGVKLLSRLREKGHHAQMVLDEPGRGMRSQMKAAAKAGAKQAVIIGEAELEGGTLTIKELASGEQHTLPESELV